MRSSLCYRQVHRQVQQKVQSWHTGHTLRNVMLLSAQNLFGQNCDTNSILTAQHLCSTLHDHACYHACSVCA